MTTLWINVGWVFSMVVAAGCFWIAMSLLIEAWAAWSTVRTRVWWTISRTKSEAVAAQYRRLIQLREMGWLEAMDAYERDVGCLHLSERWAPDPRRVLDDYFEISRQQRARDYEARFGEPWPFDA